MQWKQGVVVYIVLCIVLLYNTTPIHCPPLPLHPPVMDTQLCGEVGRGAQGLFDGHVSGGTTCALVLVRWAFLHEFVFIQAFCDGPGHA